MSTNIFNLSTEYDDLEEPAALAMIVKRVAPTSGKPGDKAIVTSSGEVKGWIGGGCTKGIVIKEAMAAIAEQKPRLVIIDQNEPIPSTPDVKYYTMTCQSGGAVEVYIEPIMQTDKLLIIGRSHIAQSLCKIAKAADFNVTIAMDQNEDEMFENADHFVKISDLDNYKHGKDSFVVVCTQGENDEVSLQKAIDMNPGYLSFVASRRKANGVYNTIKKMGVTIDQLKTIKTPAGIDIKAKTPQEVAISILAEIVEHKRSEDKVEEPLEMTEAFNDNLYINPVCKIPVQKDTAKHVLEYKGEKVYFCCDGCKESFEKDPAAYIN